MDRKYTVTHTHALSHVGNGNKNKNENECDKIKRSFCWLLMPLFWYLLILTLFRPLFDIVRYISASGVFFFSSILSNCFLSFSILNHMLNFDTIFIDFFESNVTVQTNESKMKTITMKNLPLFFTAIKCDSESQEKIPKHCFLIIFKRRVRTREGKR